MSFVIGAQYASSPSARSILLQFKQQHFINRIIIRLQFFFFFYKTDNMCSRDGSSSPLLTRLSFVPPMLFDTTKPTQDRPVLCFLSQAPYCVFFFSFCYAQGTICKCTLSYRLPSGISSEIRNALCRILNIN